MKISKKILAATLLLAAGYAGLVSAHTQSGAVGIATSGVAKTDVYVVKCPAPGAKLWAHVKDLAPVKAPLVSTQVTKGTASSSLSIDSKDGDTLYSSPAVTLAAGSGNYTLKVNKSASSVIGIETYIAEFHCQTAGGVHSDTTWSMTQNQ
jgi:hypothetical protein